MTARDEAKRLMLSWCCCNEDAAGCPEHGVVMDNRIGAQPVLDNLLMGVELASWRLDGRYYDLTLQVDGRHWSLAVLHEMDGVVEEELGRAGYFAFQAEEPNEEQYQALRTRVTAAVCYLAHEGALAPTLPADGSPFRWTREVKQALRAATSAFLKSCNCSDTEDLY